MGEGRGQRGQGGKQEENWTAPIKKAERDDKDKDNIKSARKERSFPGRLASIF